MRDVKNKHDWTERIEVVKQFFEANKPTGRMRTNHYTEILDIEKYIDANLSSAIANNGNHIFEMSIIRLEELMKFIEKK